MIPYRFRRLSLEEQRSESVAFLNRMRERRTVRDFSDEPVPFELIHNAIQVAATAPSGANQQPWRFVVVSNPEVKRRIREAAEKEERENYEHRFPPEYLEAVAPFETDWHKEFLETAPYVIVVFRQDYGLAEDGRKIKHYYVNESVGIAAGMLMTALHVSGLATLTHTPSPMNFLREILGRPANERAMIVLPVGYPAAGAMVPEISKKSLDEVMVVIAEDAPTRLETFPPVSAD